MLRTSVGICLVALVWLSSAHAVGAHHHDDRQHATFGPFDPGAVGCMPC